MSQQVAKVDAATLNEWVAVNLFGCRWLHYKSYKTRDAEVASEEYATLEPLRTIEVLLDQARIHSWPIEACEEKPDVEDIETNIPDYLCDASADAEVREKVFESYDDETLVKYVKAAAVLLRLPVGEKFTPDMGVAACLRGWKTGHAAIAAYAVDKGMDPLEVERMVRGGN